MTEHPQLETPGSRLREAREAREISLAEMSELTKIPPPVLSAIEADEYHKVSGALYIKSFLRSCATELGLDPEEILDLYGRFSGEIRPNAGAPSAVWEEEEVQITHVGLPWRSIALVGLALILVGMGALTLMRGGDRDESTGPVVAKTDNPGPESLTAGNAASQEAMPVTETSVSGPDTLAGGWVDSRDAGQPVAPVATGGRATPKVSAARTALPLPLVGGPNLVFAGGTQKPVVVRIMCDRPVAVEVKRDAETSFAGAVWPAAGADPPPLPSTGIVPGRVYAVRRGLVIYWGADDHLSLRMDRTDGVEVALNGMPRSIRNLRPGREFLLDLSGE